MTTSRDIGDITTLPDGASGADWTTRARDSLAALWALNGGMLLSVAGVDALTASIVVSGGFTEYRDGLRGSFVAPSTSTGPATININGVGTVAILDPQGSALEPGAIDAGRLIEIVFLAEEDGFRLVSLDTTKSITVDGGVYVQASAPSRLVTAAGPATALTVVAAASFQCGRSTSSVVAQGAVSRVTGSGVADNDGVVIGIYVDGALVQSFTDHCQPSAHVSTPFYFSYLPGDTDAHTYEIRVSSMIAATYPKGANGLRLSEIAKP